MAQPIRTIAIDIEATEYVSGEYAVVDIRVPLDKGRGAFLKMSDHGELFGMR